MRNPKSLFVVLLTVPFMAMAQVNIDILEGTWKVEGRESYEVWEREGQAFSGFAFKMKEDQKVIKEVLKIEEAGGDVVYTATVPNQNSGGSIPFRLNVEEKELLSFENPAHDFPVKIRYKPESADRLFVEVLGADGKGFSFYMDKVE